LASHLPDSLGAAGANFGHISERLSIRSLCSSSRRRWAKDRFHLPVRIPNVKWFLGVSVLLLLSSAEAGDSPVRIARYGVSVTVPARWQGRIYARPGGLPILHEANFRLPPNDDDLGTKASMRMGARGIFIVLLESGTKTGFRQARLPIRVRRSDFLPRFKGAPPSHAFAQRRFITRNRSFSVWVQFGERKPSNAMLRRANIVLGTLRITAQRFP
jgi:hypothetical protein